MPQLRSYGFNFGDIGNPWQFWQLSYKTAETCGCFSVPIVPIVQPSPRLRVSAVRVCLRVPSCPLWFKVFFFLYLSLWRSWSRSSGWRALRFLLLRRLVSTHHDPRLRPANHQLFRNKSVVFQLAKAADKVTYLDVRQRDALAALLE